tara:strand:- start:1714 stop:2094 length:381 start_codon:yes stop_codon:yes gene_type:complete
MKLPKNGISKIVVERVQGHDLGVTTKAIIQTVRKSHKDVSEKQVKKALDNCIQRGFLIRTKKGRYKARTTAYKAPIKRVTVEETQPQRVEVETPKSSVISPEKIISTCVFASVVVSAFISTLLGAM